MAATVMMYVLPMMLGKTYDLGKDKPGLMIYQSNIMENAVRIERHVTDSQYRMVENAEEMRDFLDVNGKLSLKIKSGLVDIGGEGLYLKDSSTKSNGLEILFKLHFETVTFTIPSTVKPTADWSSLPDHFLGTHFCRSLTYGGDLVASIRIRGSDQFDLQRIKGAINGGVKASGGSFEGDIKGKLEILKQNGQGGSSMEIDYYASVPLHGVSYTIDGLIKLIEEFPQHVKKVNNGLGNPLKMELFPLNYLKETYPAYLENRGLSDELDDLENQFDDLLNTRHQLGIWITELPPNIPSSVLKKVDDFTKKLNSIYGEYVKTIDDLDVTSSASTDRIKEAFKFYRDGGNMLHQKYFRKFQTLQAEVYKEAPELRPKIGGAHYIRWGRSECSSPESEVTMVGVAAASDVRQSGSSSNFLCSPLMPDFPEPDTYSINAKNVDKVSLPLVSPIRYNGTVPKLKPFFGKNLACAHCRSSSRTALLTKMAADSCPDGWTKEYDGFLMAAGSGAKGEFICVDRDLKEPSGPVSFGTAQNDRVQHFRETTAFCGSLPCGPYQESKPLECVVCTV